MVMMAMRIIIRVMVMMDDVDDYVNRQRAKEDKPEIDYEINNNNTEIQGGDLNQPL